MISDVSKILKKILAIDGVIMSALYRIDGEILCAKTNVSSREVLTALYWLENQIKEMLYQISSRDLDEARFKFGKIVIILFPASKTTVIGVMIDEEASKYKIEIDIKTMCRKIGKLVSSF
ncbi:hypothetical protein Asulf_01891 [Archaeoglobus sulfaticallidus PM70-1]|uniref:Roadblock/LAMTOR2 domain-containing protein n=1 Tax=Archaeoglobus sulfaticallidus PM70-1 TaxID=387631 RepID=N0BHR8_9EURY|nr:hypothetical protein [Archaeoglobus sulfaticallidus]AGK61857.1 hypothetical protein Asulf_01891 [Archaeoglobus sulfaticallidus PM70-1]